MSDGPDLLERIRMCLAEVGVVDGRVYRRDDGRVALLAADMHTEWRAVSIAAWPRHLVCWSCHQARQEHADDLDGFNAATAACLAVRPCTEDCGASQ